MSTHEEIAISIQNVSKNFRLPHERHSSIKDVFINPAKLFSKRSTSEVQHALKDVSFDIKKGEFFGIVGRNGSGKSTLLKIIASIYQPTKGSVSVHGKLVPFIELGVGFNPELTGRENVYLSGALNGFSTAEMEAMYDDIVAFAELEDFMDQKLKNYSSGMQVRLAFSVATRAKADILLIDEVLAVGDADFQRKCFNYFKELKSSSITVIFVSHDMDAVREYCDRAVLIEKNKVMTVGSSSSVAKQYSMLFQDQQGHAQPRTSSRWGNGDAEYSNVKVSVARSANENVIKISADIVTNKKIEDPVAGFTIFDGTRRPILGTNTAIKQEKLKPLVQGDKKSIVWEVPDIFNDGEYFVELALVFDTMSTVADWWENAGSFVIRKNERTPYVVNPETIFMVKDN